MAKPSPNLKKLCCPRGGNPQRPPDTSIEVWFQVEMRVCQKKKLTYLWAKTGSRPRTDHDQRTKSDYLFGPIYPERGTTAALVMPACNNRIFKSFHDILSHCCYAWNTLIEEMRAI